MDSSDVSRERSKLNVMDVAANDATARRMRTTDRLLLMRVVSSLIARDLSTSERTLDGGHFGLRSWRVEVRLIYRISGRFSIPVVGDAHVGPTTVEK